MLPLLSVVIFVYSKETLLHFHNTPEVSDSGAVYPEEFVEQMMATPDAKLCKALAQMRFSWGENGRLHQLDQGWIRTGSRNSRMVCFLYSILLAVVTPGMRQRHATLINSIIS